MAKRIVWTEKADFIFTKSLKYYVDRNKSKEYSRKLNKDIRAYLEILSKQPLLGKKTNEEDIRVIILAGMIEKGTRIVVTRVEAAQLYVEPE